MNLNYIQCKRCVMDTSNDRNFKVNEHGLCNYCLQFDEANNKLPSAAEKKSILEKTVNKIKAEGKGKTYDCILGVSGGVDSTFLACWCYQNNLRPLLVHMDNGWDSELAMRNIENICTKLNFELNTYVINWTEFKELQLAYIKAGVVDIEVLTDQAIHATLLDVAKKYNIKYVLSGNNIATESIMPKSWVFDKTDWRNTKDIYLKFGNGVPVKTFPHMSFLKKLYNYWFLRLETLQVLNYLDYNQDEAKKLITDKAGWQDCGGKHHESRFTRFYQTYILPEKFKIDKRKPHLSNLICSGQLSKEAALAVLEKPPYDAEKIKDDKAYLLKKLELSPAEFETLMHGPIRLHQEFKTEKHLWENYFKLISILKLQFLKN